MDPHTLSIGVLPGCMGWNFNPQFYYVTDLHFVALIASPEIGPSFPLSLLSDKIDKGVPHEGNLYR